MHIFNEQEIERHLGVQLSLTSQSEKLIEVEVTNFPPTYKKKGYHQTLLFNEPVGHVNMQVHTHNPAHKHVTQRYLIAYLALMKP